VGWLVVFDKFNHPKHIAPAVVFDKLNHRKHIPPRWLSLSKPPALNQ
jgi:hypothetical protein